MACLTRDLAQVRKGAPLIQEARCLEAFQGKGIGKETFFNYVVIGLAARKPFMQQYSSKGAAVEVFVNPDRTGWHGTAAVTAFCNRHAVTAALRGAAAGFWYSTASARLVGRGGATRARLLTRGGQPTTA